MESLRNAICGRVSEFGKDLRSEFGKFPILDFAESMYTASCGYFCKNYRFPIFKHGQSAYLSTFASLFQCHCSLWERLHNLETKIRLLFRAYLTYAKTVIGDVSLGLNGVLPNTLRLQRGGFISPRPDLHRAIKGTTQSRSFVLGNWLVIRRVIREKEMTGVPSYQ